MFNGHKIAGLCITKISDEGSFMLINELNEALLNVGYRLFIYQSNSDFYRGTQIEDGDKAIFKAIDYDAVDVVIIYERVFCDKNVVLDIIRDCNKYHKPIMVIGEKYEDCIRFDFDPSGAFADIVEHVITCHGAKDIRLVAGINGEATSERRISVYKEVMDRFDLDYDGKIYYGEYWKAPTLEVMDGILADEKRPDAIICLNDNMAVTVCAAIKNAGLRVPEDIMVTGIDGMPAAMCHNPRITTAVCDYGRMAEMITKVITAMEKKEDISEEYLIEYSLSVGASCGCTCSNEDLNPGEVILKQADGITKYQNDERTLYEMGEKIFKCRSQEEIIDYLYSCQLVDYEMLLNSDCFDETINPVGYKRDSAYDDTMLYVYGYNEDPRALPKAFERKNVIPNAELVMDRKNPVIFSGLSFMGVPNGILCMYGDPEITHYRKIQQCVTTFNNAIGTYRLYNHLNWQAVKVEYASEHDYLSGLYNRSGFFKHLPKLIRYASDTKSSILLSIMDMNNLKVINDRFGHKEGDFALKALADAVSSLVFDYKLCCRYGGDEMVVCAVLSDKDASEKIESQMNKLLTAVNEKSVKPYRITASIGTVITKPKEFIFKNQLQQADDLMYEMKQKIKKEEMSDIMG